MRGLQFIIHKSAWLGPRSPLIFLRCKEMKTTFPAACSPESASRTGFCVSPFNHWSRSSQFRDLDYRKWKRKTSCSFPFLLLLSSPLIPQSCVFWLRIQTQDCHLKVPELYTRSQNVNWKSDQIKQTSILLDKGICYLVNDALSTFKPQQKTPHKAQKKRLLLGVLRAGLRKSTIWKLLPKIRFRDSTRPCPRLLDSPALWRRFLNAERSRVQVTWVPSFVCWTKSRLKLTLLLA